MTDLEAVGIRRSRRSYIGQPDPAQFEHLRHLAHQLAEQSKLVIRLLEDSGDLFGKFTKHYGLFSGVESFLMLGGMVDDPDCDEKAGYFGERLILEATKMGLGSCWVSGTFDRTLLQSTLTRNQKLVAVIPMGQVKQTPGIKERVLYSVARRAGKSAREMFQADQDPPDWFMKGVNAAALAPSARNLQPVLFGWKHAQASAWIPDLNGRQGVDLGIAKLHFEIGAKGRFTLGNHAVFHKEGES